MMRMIIVLKGGNHVTHCVPEKNAKEMVRDLSNALKEATFYKRWADFGDCFFDLLEVQGFYILPPDADQDLKIKERMAKTMEKLVGDATSGDQWKKPEE